MENCELRQGDCLEVMTDIPDRSVDMILCDLPYGVTASKWDVQINIHEIWNHYNRIIKSDGSVALFGSQPFTTDLIESNRDDFKYCWYWVKNQGTNFFHAKRMPIRKVEEICIFKSGKYYPQFTDGHQPTNSAKGCSNGQTYYGTNKRDYDGGSTVRFPTNILDFKCVNNYHKLHPNEKPTDLLGYLIRTYTEEGNVILDNCMGSGSTGVAALKSNRRFIGIELDPTYCGIAKERIQHIVC